VTKPSRIEELRKFIENDDLLNKMLDSQLIDKFINYIETFDKSSMKDNINVQ